MQSVPLESFRRIILSFLLHCLDACFSYFWLVFFLLSSPCSSELLSSLLSTRRSRL
ncbi:hypothetical protein CSUI_007598 [Cystoisospora suis]|uniref:Transmembrane protein n=1 Tax=Cystoisospora suis TaxID=483139 RepID=A0A2C6KQ21_9APIC|nr:hypothetical protein CSUI_007598 [Cystoisospora suis]